MIGPTVANFIAIQSWIAPIALLPGSLVLITAPHGGMAVIGGLCLGTVLAGGPKTFMFRLALFGALSGVAYTSPSPWTSMFGLGSLLVMLGMITVVPGGRSKWSR